MLPVPVLVILDIFNTSKIVKKTMSSGAGNLAGKIYFLPVKGKIGRYHTVTVTVPVPYGIHHVL